MQETKYLKKISGEAAPITLELLTVMSSVQIAGLFHPSGVVLSVASNVANLKCAWPHFGLRGQCP